MALVEIELLDDAKSDFRESLEWYKENATAKVAREFAVAIEHSLIQISAHPGSGPVFRENVRRIYVGPFPYWIYYVEATGRILVVAIFHAKMDIEAHLNRRL